MSVTAVDAVIVGAGPNGLAAAIEIAAAGRSVVVHEAAPTVGGGTRTAELTTPGFHHDVCSAVHPLLLASPFFRGLDLERFGLEVLHPELPFVHPLDGGDGVEVRRSVEETAAGLGADGPAYERLMRPLVERVHDLMEGTLGPLALPRHPVTMGRFGLNAVRSASGLVRRFEGERARALFAGAAAHSMLPLDRSPTAGVALTLVVLAHAVGWPVVRGGSQGIADALAARLLELGGEIVTDSPVGSLDDLPRARAVLFDVTPRQLVAIAGPALGDRYVRALGRFRYGPGVFKVDWALDGPVPWDAGGARRAGTVHIGGTFSEVADSEAAAFGGRPPERPYVLTAQPSVIDGSRAPAGKHTLWAYCHVPSGATVDMTEAIESQIERFAPGFRELVLDRSVHGPQAMEEYNANYVGGDINGGIQTLRQHFGRPVLRLSPYTTPNDRIFLCSSSTPPGGGVHGMCGYHAARAALRRALR